MGLTQRPTGHELFPILVIFFPDNPVPQPRRIIPLVDCDTVNRLGRHRCSVVVIPPYLHKLPVMFIIFAQIQDGKFVGGGDHYAFVATGVPLDGIRGEDFVGSRISLLEEVGAAESINEERGAACAVCV